MGDVEEFNVQCLEKKFHYCIVHSGTDIEFQFEYFIRNKLEKLGVQCGPMDYTESDSDTAIFNDNLKTIKQSRKVVLLFCKPSHINRRCRFERLFALHLHSQTKLQLPIIIPVAIGAIIIPEKYRVFHEIFVDGSTDWCLKLLQALTDGISEDCKQKMDEIFANNGRDEIDSKVNTEEITEEADDFDEYGTAFDTICFHFLDEFMRDRSDYEEESTGELAEILQIQSQLCQKLQASTLKTRIEFLRRNSTSGMFSYIGQMGLNNVHKILMQGCGMTVTRDLISLKWKTFEQNLVCSTVTLADIVNLSKFVGIKRISIQFDKETHDKVEQNYGKNWQGLLVTFAERILKRRFGEFDNETLTYHITSNGMSSNSVKRILNKTGRNIYLEHFENQNRDYTDLAARLKTFRNWPLSAKTKPLDLAKAGFIYSNHEDTVTCFSCNQSLYALDRFNIGVQHQEALLSHCYWNENCDFLKSLPGYETLKKLSAVAKNAIKEPEIIDNILFEKNSNRFKSFDSALPRLRCLEFARAGFYQKIYEKNNLSVTCFSCSTEINSIKLSQDPWIEHVRWSPKCSFVMEQKGHEFVDDTMKVLATEDEDDVYTEIIIETFLMKRKRLHSQSEATETIPKKLRRVDDDIELD